MDVKRKKCGFTPLEIEISNWAGNRRSKRFLTGFTLVELLTTLAIIGMLVGLLIPALSLVRKITKETKQKAQLTTIGLALATFKNDYDGEYPPSDWKPPPENDYCGAQKLAEALLGWDLLGFHPKSAWRADGFDGLTPQGLLTYDPPKTRNFEPIGAPDGVPDTLNERRGRYLELATTNAFRLGISAPANQDGLFDDPAPLERNTFVICDVFGVKKIRIGQKTVKAGTPILYYRANTSGKTIREIYNVRDNVPLITILKSIADGKDHPLGDPGGMYQFFYGDLIIDPDQAIGYIQDPKITAPAPPWPYRPDSYILISAGADGEYGTNDDIRNFGK